MDTLLFMIILLVGLPATGKTFIANHIIKKLDDESASPSFLLETDSIRRYYFDFDEHKRLPFHQGVYQYEKRLQVYQAMFAALGVIAEQGANVIVTGTFGEQKLREQVNRIAQQTKQDLLVIHTICSDEMAAERLNARISENNLSDAGLEIYLNLKAKFEPLTLPHLEIDTEKNIDRIMQTIDEFLKV